MRKMKKLTAIALTVPCLGGVLGFNVGISPCNEKQPIFFI